VILVSVVEVSLTIGSAPNAGAASHSIGMTSSVERIILGLS
jgi:hypothetical protein